MSILLLKPVSKNGVLSDLTQQLFDQLKHVTRCDLFDESVQSLSKAAFFNYIQRMSPRAIISFNAAGAELELVMPNHERKNLFSLVPSLHIGWMVDHPVYHIPRLAPVNPKRLILFPTQDTISFAEDFKLSGTFSALPFAGSDNGLSGKDHCDRAFDVVVAASWMGYPEGFASVYSSPLKDVVAKTISMIHEKPFLDPYYILLDTLLENRLQSENKEFLAKLTKELYDYQRKINRINIIDSLVNSGLTVGIIGQGWNSYFGERNNVTYFDNIAHNEIMHLYQNAKVVVNVNAVNGASERLFDAIDAGAMVYSEFSMMLYDMFGSGNGVLFHNIHATESSIDLLKDIILNSETELWASSAKEKVLSAHTWKHRALFLNEVVSAFASE